jgi:hypothetical protein
MGAVNQFTNAIGLTDTEKNGSLLDQAVDVVSDPGNALHDAGQKVSDGIHDVGSAVASNPVLSTAAGLALTAAGVPPQLAAGLIAANAGGSPEQIIKAAVIAGAVQEFSPAVADKVSAAVGGGAVGAAAANALIAGGIAAVTGGNVLQAMVAGGVSSGVNTLLSSIPEYATAPKAVQAAVRATVTTALTSNKNPSTAFINSLVGSAGQAIGKEIGDQVLVNKYSQDLFPPVEGATATGNPDAAAKIVGFTDAATADKYNWDTGAYQTAQNEQQATDAHFPDYATFKQYKGDLGAYQTDVKDQALTSTFRSVLGRDPTQQEYQQFINQPLDSMQLAAQQYAVDVRDTVNVGNADANSIEEAVALAKSRNPSATQFTYGGGKYSMSASNDQLRNAYMTGQLDNIRNMPTFNEAYAAARQLGVGTAFDWTNPATGATSQYVASTAAERPDLVTKDPAENQSAAETKRLAAWNLKATPDESPAETQRLLNAGNASALQNVSTMAAQALGTTSRGVGNLITNIGLTYAQATGDFNYDNAFTKAGKEIEAYAKSKDVYGLDVQKNRIMQAVALSESTTNMFEKANIIGAAISKNPIGFFDIAGSELVEELPETAIQIGAALATGGGSIALATGKGIVTGTSVLGSFMESFGSSGKEVYDKAKAAGMDEQTARDKAYVSASLGFALELGPDLIADKALVGPMMRSFADKTLANIASGYVSNVAIGSATELVSGAAQNYMTQYQIDPNKADWNKAVSNGVFEAFIGGTVQTAMATPGSVVDTAAVIGKDYSGNNVTLQQVMDGTANIDLSTVRPDVAIVHDAQGNSLTVGSSLVMGGDYGLDLADVKQYLPADLTSSDVVVATNTNGNTITFGDVTSGQANKQFDSGLSNYFSSVFNTNTVSGGSDITTGVNNYYNNTKVVTADDVTRIANNVVAANPGITADQAAQIVTTAITSNPNVTANQINALIQNQVSNTVTQNKVGDVQTNLTNTRTALETAIADAKASGLAGDAALQAGLDKVAADLGLTKTDLLTQMGTTAEQLRTDFSTQIGEVRTDVANTRTALETAIADAKASGLAGDAALQAGLDKVAADLGLTKTDLLTQLDTTAEQLRTDFGTQIGGVRTDIATTRTALETAIADAVAQGKTGDAALQAGLDKVAADLGVAKTDLLTQMGTTADQLRTDFSTQIGAVKTAVEQTTQNVSDLTNRVASLDDTTKQRFELLTDQQKADVERLTQQNIDLKAAINAVDTSTTDKITTLNKDLTAKLAKSQKQTQAAIDTATAKPVSFLDEAKFSYKPINLDEGKNAPILFAVPGLAAAFGSQQQQPMQQTPSYQDMFFGTSETPASSSQTQEQTPQSLFGFAAGGHVPNMGYHPMGEPEFYSEGGMQNTYIEGRGDGTSDSIPAMVAANEYVLPADIVSSLGNGSSDAGASILDRFVREIRQHKHSNSPDELPPDSRGPLEYLAGAMKGRR